MTAKKRDTNHQEIRDALRSAGLATYDLASMGCGYPDLLCVREDGRVFLIEVKSDGGQLTKDEVKFILISANPAYRIFTEAEKAVKTILEAN